MRRLVFDASALLAIIRREPTIPLSEVVASASISSVNYVEVLSRLRDPGSESSDQFQTAVLSSIDVVDFTREQAEIAAALRPLTRHLGLSLGDRCCLALAINLDGPVYTADRIWLQLNVPIQVRFIRPDPLV